MFRVGDEVIDTTGRGEGTIISIKNSDSFPIHTSFGATYKTDGRYQGSDTYPSLKKRESLHSGTTIERIPGIANLITLPDGTRIYHPDSGQPFQLTSKETLI